MERTNVSGPSPKTQTRFTKWPREAVASAAITGETNLLRLGGVLFAEIVAR